MPRNYRFTEDAREDLKDIKAYIRKDNPKAAKELGDRIAEKCQVISQQPGIGVDCSRYGSGMRSVSLGNYIIYYRESSPRIEIIRVLHGARDIDSIFPN